MNKLSFIRLVLLQIILVSCAMTGRSPASPLEVKHLVLDIDWTIVSEIKDPNVKVNPTSRVVEVQGIRYFINEGLEELIENALKFPDVKISFFSGGKKVRNEELLSKIKLSNGKSLKDISTHILNAEDLVKNPSASEGAKFAERFKKDLRLVGQNLAQIIMLDDTPNFVLDTFEKQSDSVFFIGKAFEYFDKFEDTIGLRGEYVPLNYDSWFLNRKKLYILSEAFKASYFEAQTGACTLLECMKKREAKLDLKSHNWNSYSRLLYSKALRSMEKFPEDNCLDLVSQLITL